MINLNETETWEQIDAGYWHSEWSGKWYQKYYKNKERTIYGWGEVTSEDDLWYLNEGDLPRYEPCGYDKLQY